jgi:predicted acetyltransferase
MRVDSSMPANLLFDDAIELRLLRVLGPDNPEARPVEARFLSVAPEIRFAIHRRSDGLRVGRTHLRITDDPVILRAVGHAGYEVAEAHRRQGHATRAVRLICGLARHYKIAPLWVLIAPENIASRLTVERVGFRLVDIVDASPEAIGLGTEPRLCRYAMN